LYPSVNPSVCLSVRPSVAYIANNLRTQRPKNAKFGRKVAHLRCDSHTSFKVERSKVRVTRPIYADTHCAQYLPNGKAIEVQTWYTDGGRRAASVPPRSKIEVTRSGDQSEMCRKRIVVVPSKLAGGHPMTRDTLRTTFKVKGERSRSQAD